MVLKHIGLNTLLHITNLFKALALLGKVPTLWYESRVILLAKAGKDNYAKKNGVMANDLGNNIVFYH